MYSLRKIAEEPPQVMFFHDCLDDPPDCIAERSWVRRAVLQSSGLTSDRVPLTCGEFPGFLWFFPLKLCNLLF